MNYPLTMAVSLGVLLAACSPAGDQTTDADSSSAGEVAGRASAERAELAVDGTVSGEIVSVEPLLQRFLLEVDGANWEFRYTDDTQITGAAGVQGLAERAGSRASVDYDGTESDPSRVAVRVQLLGTTVGPAVP